MDVQATEALPGWLWRSPFICPAMPGKRRRPGGPAPVGGRTPGARCPRRRSVAVGRIGLRLRTKSDLRVVVVTKAPLPQHCNGNPARCKRFAGAQSGGSVYQTRGWRMERRTVTSCGSLQGGSLGNRGGVSGRQALLGSPDSPDSQYVREPVTLQAVGVGGKKRDSTDSIQRTQKNPRRIPEWSPP